MNFKKWLQFFKCFTLSSKDRPVCARDDQKHVMTQEEQLDETIDNSFPASDPPGHYSKSLEDKRLHPER